MAIGNPQGRQVRDDRAKVGEGQLRAELQPIGRGRDTGERRGIALEFLKDFRRGHSASLTRTLTLTGGSSTPCPMSLALGSEASRRRRPPRSTGTRVVVSARLQATVNGP